MRTLFANPDMAGSLRSIKLSTRRYYVRPIDREMIETPENVEHMHYYLESRTIDDQIEALTVTHDVRNLPASRKAAIPTQILIASTSTATESLHRVQNEQPSQALGKLFKRPFTLTATKVVTVEQNLPGLSTGLPVSFDAEEIARNVMLGDWRAVLTYLIYRLPYLQTITIEEDQYTPRSETLNAIVQRALSPNSITIPALQKLVVNYTRRTNTSKLNTYWHLLLQPSLRSFSARKIQEYGWRPEPRNLLLPLTHLSFSQCNLSTSSIDAFMKCCPHLTYLYYEHTQSWGEQPFCPNLFGDSIRHLRGTLHKLVLLRPEPQYNVLSVRDNEFTIFGSVLQEFEVLEDLEITTHLLLGPQPSPKSAWFEASKRTTCQKSTLEATLPHSLEKLTLRDAAENSPKMVRDLVIKNRQIVPVLGSVHICLTASMSAERAINASAKIIYEELGDEITWDRKETVNGVRIRESWLTAAGRDSSPERPLRPLRRLA